MAPYLTALRGRIRKNTAPQRLMGGQRPQPGRFSLSERPHLALLPLGYVGSEYADGHLLGVALAFPRDISLEQRGKLVGKLLYDARGQSKEIRLTLGKLGVWTLGEELRPSPPKALQSANWTGPATTWASVSPVVLDRHPKGDPRKDRSGYHAEVASIVFESCRRIGPPRPGRNRYRQNLLASREHHAPSQAPTVTRSCPSVPAARIAEQVHVWMRFDRPVLGPVLLGGGRYQWIWALQTMEMRRPHASRTPTNQRTSDPHHSRPSRRLGQAILPQSTA